jgi:hypothetical protein
LENLILGDKDMGVQTRKRLASAPEYANFSLLSKIKPKNFIEANKDMHCIEAM